MFDRKTVTLSMALLLLAGNLALAQANANNDDDDDDKQTQTTELRAALKLKREACRKEATGKGMRGPDARDHVQVCVLEARLTCLKQAVAQKIRGKERITLISGCLSAPG